MMYAGLPVPWLRRAAPMFLVAAGGVAVWIAALELIAVYGPFSIAVGITYLLGAGVALATLRWRREPGVFLCGAFAVNCAIGCWSSLGQLAWRGEPYLWFAATGLLLGAIGTILRCLQGAGGSRPRTLRGA